MIKDESYWTIKVLKIFSQTGELFYFLLISYKKCGFEMNEQSQIIQFILLKEPFM